VAPSVDAALDLAHAITPPTLIVHSGWGLQPLWLFEAPWVLDDDSRRTAAAMAIQWRRLYQERVGWKVDPATDLARLLRLVGTMNAKGEPTPVHVLEQEGGRYEFAELRERCERAGPVSPPKVAAHSEAPAQLDKVALRRLLDTDERFRSAWHHERDGNLSTSQYDLALCSIAAGHGWSAEQLRALIFAHREKYEPGGPKQRRSDYLNLTVAKALNRTEPATAPAQRPPAAAQQPPKPESYTDTGNGERFAAQHAHHLRYLRQRRQWLVWQDGRWRPDTTGEAERAAKDVARSLLVEASQLEGEASKDAAKWALQSQSEPRLRAQLSLAGSERAVVVSAEELDAARTYSRARTVSSTSARASCANRARTTSSRWGPTCPTSPPPPATGGASSSTRYSRATRS